MNNVFHYFLWMMLATYVIAMVSLRFWLRRKKKSGWYFPLAGLGLMAFFLLVGLGIKRWAG